MGVKSCDRYGCDNIMCDRCSNEYGYICSDCFDELVDSGPATDVFQFMHQRKPLKVNYGAAFARFDVEFPLDNLR